MACAEKRASVVLLGSCMNFQVPDIQTQKKRLSKYRIFISSCVKFRYRYRDLEGLQFFHGISISLGLHGALGACLVMWHKSRRNSSFLRRCSGWEYTVRNSSRAIHQDYFGSDWRLLRMRSQKPRQKSFAFSPWDRGK